MRKPPFVRGALLVAWLTVPAGSAVAAPGPDDDLLTTPSPKAIAMAFDFSARAATDAYFATNLRPLLLPDWSRCYLRIRTAARARPLFVTGHGRRGSLAFSFVPDPVAGRGGYNISCEGGAIAEFTDYQATPEAAGADLSGADWARQGGKWRLTVRRVRSVTARDVGDELRRFLDRRYIAARPGINEPDPVAFLRARVDLELASPTGTADLGDREADIAVSVIETERFGRRHPYWSISISTALKVDGRQLGLKEAGTETVDVSVVLGAVQWVPAGIRSEEAPEVNEAGVGDEGKIGAPGP